MFRKKTLVIAVMLTLLLGSVSLHADAYTWSLSSSGSSYSSGSGSYSSGSYSSGSYGSRSYNYSSNSSSDSTYTSNRTSYNSGSSYSRNSFYGYNQSSDSNSNYSSGSGSTSTYNNSGSTYRYSNSQSSSVLKYGSVGADVKEVQQYLKQLNYDLRGENGRFGYYTLKAVLDFQRKNGLTANGKVDTTTLTKIKSAAGGNQTPSNPTPTTPEQPQEPQTPAQPTPQQPDTRGLTTEEKQMLDMVNNERQKRGLAPLKIDMELVELARKKSQDMIDNNYFSHTSPTYGSPFSMLRNAGVSYTTAGENLAGGRTVSRAHTNLMNSSGHRKNILNSKYTHVGIGIIDGGPYGKMFTQLFIGR